jgi:eukaryotic-like serine/threonine-protein kinase
LTSLSTVAPIARIGKYDLLGRIAAGGMAEIFLARESGPHSVGRLLVVKRILPHVADDPRMVEMFVHEAQLSMHLSHPHICPIHEFGEADGTFYLAMEWVRGVSLRQLLDRVKGTPLPISFVVRLFADLAGALHHAHTCRDPSGQRLNIVHRDVNPENLMIGFDGVVKLLDFGVAKASTQTDKTEAGMLKGKFAYISPEQYQGQPVDGRADVFSLGVSFYEALTGRSIFERASEYETVAAIVLDPSVPSVREVRTEVPEDLDAIVRRAMEKDREHRFATADEMQAALTRWLAAQHISVRHPDISRALKTLVPDLFGAEPRLDRRPPTRSNKLPTPEPVRDGNDEMQSLLLGQSADDDLEEMMGGRRRRQITLGIVSALLIIASTAVIGWVVYRRQNGQSVIPSSDETSRILPSGD